MYGRSSPVRPCASCTVATPSSPSFLMSAASARLMFLTTLDMFVDARVDLPRVALEDLLPPRRIEIRRRVDVAPGVVVVEAGFGIDAADGADHLRSEQDVVDRHDLRQQVDTRLVIHASVEEHVVADHVGERRTLHVLGEPAVPAPVIRDAAAAVRDDHPELREVLEEIRLDELHE